MRKFSIVFFLMVVAFAIEAKSEKPAPPNGAKAQVVANYTPTAEQIKDLEIDRLNALLAQSNWTVASNALPEHAAYSKALETIGADCTNIIKKNKWPSTVNCQIANLNDKKFSFIDSAAPAEKK